MTGDVMGPFRRNWISPAWVNVGIVTHIEATRQIVAYLAENGCLGDALAWDDMTPMAREAWMDALSARYAQAHKEAAKAAITELAVFEVLAVKDHPCRKCHARAREQCRDLRFKALVHNKHVHKERLDDAVAEST